MEMVRWVLGGAEGIAIVNEKTREIIKDFTVGDDGINNIRVAKNKARKFLLGLI